MEIRNIVLDLGMVLLDIDYDLTTNAFINLGYENFREMYSQYKADQLFEKLEMGKVSREELYSVLEKIHDVTDQQIQDAWNAMILHYRKSSFEWLASVKDEYRFFLLSNTNVIHKERFDGLFEEEMGGKMDDYFERAYYSHLVGMRKPDREIFEFVIQDAGIIPAETLFVDDLYPNIDTAKKLGFQTWLLKKGELVEEIVPALIE